MLIKHAYNKIAIEEFVSFCDQLPIVQSRSGDTLLVSFVRKHRSSEHGYISGGALPSLVAKYYFYSVSVS